MGTTTTATTVLLTHEVTGSFTMNVSDAILDLDAGEQTVFTNLLDESMASLLNISSDNVESVVSSFLQSRRLSMLTQENTVTFTRRLAGTDISVSYTVYTTEDQVSSITDGITSTVATGLADQLTDAIAADGRLNVTVFGVSDFSTPKSSVIGSSDTTEVVTDMPITTSTIGLPITTTTMTIITTSTTYTTTYTTTHATTTSTIIATTVTTVIGTTTTTITTILATHTVTGSFTMTVSADIADLDEAGQEKFTALVEASIAALLGVSDDQVDAEVTFPASRRLSMLTQESVLALARRLETADLAITYSISTTGDQVDSIASSLTSTVQSNLATHLTDAIAADGSLNITVHAISDFTTPEITETSPGDGTVTDDDDDGLSTGIIVVIVLCGLGIPICMCGLYLLYRRRQPKKEDSGNDAEQPSQVEAVET